ncbi:MAG: hypothetical protein ACYC3X_25445 [Pirellulaceae bacterium]
MTIDNTTTRDQAEIKMRLWLAPVLNITEQAAFELLHHAYDSELLEIDALQAAKPNDRLQAIKAITTRIYARQNLPTE